MSATQTLAVEKILIRHKFTEEEATEILDYVENQKGDFATKQDIALVKQEIESVKQNISMLKWAVGLLAVLVLSGFAWLASEIKYVRQDLKAEIDRRFTEQKKGIDRRFTEQKEEMNRRFVEQKQDIKSINEKLDRLLSREKK